jgi:hypothetical protein
MNHLSIHDWDEHQTYRKDRGQPPWIKVHRHIMRNMKWVALDDAERGQLVAIWLLAADHNGVIPASPHLIQKLCFMSDTPNLQKFIDLGFLDGEWRQDDAMPTPTRRQRDEPKAEAEADTEAETEREAPKRAARFRPPTQEEVVEYCRQRGNNVNAQKLFAYYHANGWVQGRSKIKNWHAVVHYWEQNENETSKRNGNGSGSRARRVADTLDGIIRDGLPEERAERVGGGDLSETAGDLREPLDGEYRRH